MLFYQFLHFMIKIHKHGLKFGHLDFSNLYFTKNSPKHKASRSKVSSSRLGSYCDDCGDENEENKTMFLVDLMFVDKNLPNLI